MTRKLMAGILLLALTTSPALAGGETVVVSIKDFSFNPPEITVPVGTTVRWEND